MADLKWIKVAVDLFEDDKIMIIESLPEADSIILIWIKMLTLAGKLNNSGVFIMSGIEKPYTAKQLALIFRRKESTVNLALHTFEQLGMISVIDGVITIPNWGKHQSTDRLERIKEYQKKYQHEYYLRQKKKALGSVKTEENFDSNFDETSDESLTQTFSNRIEENRTEKKKKRKDKDESSILFVTVIDYLNLKAGTSYRPSTPKTKTLISTRVSEGFTVDDFKAVIDSKTSEWLGTEMEKYLRPETLFGTKFEGYLQSGSSKKTTQATQKSSRTFDADELDAFKNLF